MGIVGRSHRGLRIILAVSLSVFVLAILLLADHVNGAQVSLSAFYLIPVLLATWYAGAFTGVLFSVLSAAGWSSDNIFKLSSGSFLVVPWWDVVMEFAFLLVVVYLLTSLKRAFMREQDMARQDYLTKTANARFFYELFGAEILRARRYKHPFALAYMDIDNFKAVNDSLGHQAGDRLLYDLAVTLKSGVRAVDVVARLGGDEFAVMMPETEQAGAEAVISRIREGIGAYAKKNGRPITVSIGAIACRSGDCDADDILKQADKLMYDVKKSGKNSFKIVSMEGAA